MYSSDGIFFFSHQSSMSHDPSEIILICGSAAQYLYIYRYIYFFFTNYIIKTLVLLNTYVETNQILNCIIIHLFTVTFNQFNACVLYFAV